ncbi:hypothetical protein [Tropicibacter oceani]|uniref:Uncharacterized protein n=1 Tax=Tropicibacter oceani TaxID=3058420 RepID=A0ABY8QNE5_9RHOB|nr:hypothetical protein [Tropicibacter oceani]WGW05558.1 hypothetical protein QF118_08430 [Tropicibacter oceani]
MKAMFAGFAAMAVIGIGAYFALQEIGFSAAERNSGAAVRLN